MSNYLSNQDDWITNQYQILSELIYGNGDTLFERKDNQRVLAFPQYKINDVK